MSQKAGKPKVRIQIKDPNALCPADWEKDPVPGVCYHLREPVEDRHKALMLAIAKAGGLETWRRLNVLVVFFKNKPELRKIAMADRDWVKKMCEAHCPDMKTCGAGKCKARA